MRRKFTMPRNLVLRLACSVLVWCSPALADDLPDDTEGNTVDRAQSDIQRDAQRLGKSAGVKPEVLEGSGGYGSAGCGLGSVIIKPSEHFTQIFAATTNGLFGNQTFGITSGTSNCDGPPKPLAALQRFVVANRSALSIATARGRGEPIVAVAAIAGCREPHELGLVLQRHFGRIFTDATAPDLQVTRAMLAVMRGHSELDCSVLSG